MKIGTLPSVMHTLLPVVFALLAMRSIWLFCNSLLVIVEKKEVLELSFRVLLFAIYSYQ